MNAQNRIAPLFLAAVILLPLLACSDVPIVKMEQTARDQGRKIALLNVHIEDVYISWPKVMPMFALTGAFSQSMREKLTGVMVKALQD